MKLVKESLNEIRQDKETGLGALGVGKVGMLRSWGDQNFDEYNIKDGVIYPLDVEEYPSAKWVESGQIPDYVKIIAFKPFNVLEENDEVYDFSDGKPREFYVVEKLMYDDPNIRSIIDKFVGQDAYDSFYKFHIDNKENFVIVEKWNDDGTTSKYLKLYDYWLGVIGTFIYNE